jgi:hypothetical protein
MAVMDGNFVGANSNLERHTVTDGYDRAALGSKTARESYFGPSPCASLPDKIDRLCLLKNLLWCLRVPPPVAPPFILQTITLACGLRKATHFVGEMARRRKAFVRQIEARESRWGVFRKCTEANLLKYATNSPANLRPMSV